MLQREGERKGVVQGRRGGVAGGGGRREKLMCVRKRERERERGSERGTEAVGQRQIWTATERG